jgi:polysaccharide biosynthesis protein PelA
LLYHFGMALKQFFFLLFSLPAFLTGTFKEDERFIVYYSDKAPFFDFNPYSLIIFDSDFHPEITPLLEREKIILGYLSLGEVERYRFYYQEALDAGLLLEENKNWPHSFMVDVRNPLWAKIVIEKIIPSILTEKFKGLFFDTLDNALFLEEKDPVKYKGMVQAAGELVEAIRRHYPNIYLMTNRAYFLLPDIGDKINSILAESVYTSYDFKKKKYFFVEEKEYKETVSTLKKITQKHKNLTVYSLDYWYPEKKEEIKKIYKKERENGFIPYVGTIHLDVIVHEPS